MVDLFYFAEPESYDESKGADPEVYDENNNNHTYNYIVDDEVA